MRQEAGGSASREASDADREGRDVDREARNADREGRDADCEASDADREGCDVCGVYIIQPICVEWEGTAEQQDLTANFPGRIEASQAIFVRPLFRPNNRAAQKIKKPGPAQADSAFDTRPADR